MSDFTADAIMDYLNRANDENPAALKPVLFTVFAGALLQTALEDRLIAALVALEDDSSDAAAQQLEAVYGWYRDRLADAQWRAPATLAEARALRCAVPSQPPAAEQTEAPPPRIN